MRTPYSPCHIIVCTEVQICIDMTCQLFTVFSRHKFLTFSNFSFLFCFMHNKILWQYASHTHGSTLYVHVKGNNGSDGNKIQKIIIYFACAHTLFYFIAPNVNVQSLWISYFNYQFGNFNEKQVLFGFTKGVSATPANHSMAFDFFFSHALRRQTRKNSEELNKYP